MMWRMVLSLPIAVLLGAFAFAQDVPPEKGEPPLRLQKKTKPNAGDAAKPPAADEKKPELPKKAEPKDDPEPPVEAATDEKETLERIARNVGKVEERLGKKDVGDATQQIQKDILKDIDSLIQLSQQQQQNQQQSENDPSQPMSGQPMPGAGQKGSGPQSGQHRPGAKRTSRRNQMVRSRRPGQGTQPQEQSAQTGDQPGGGGPKLSKDEANKIADVFKDVWGHLPESMRAEMDAYSREQFMFKYKPLIEQYYSAISEKSRRKGD